MTDRWKIYTLWAAAGALLATGALLSVATVRAGADARARLEKRRAELARLGALEARAQSYDAARQAVAAALPADGRPMDLNALLSVQNPPLRPEETSEKRDALGDGWSRVRRSLTFGSAPIASVMTFVRAAESARPRWRVVQCTVSALPASGGAGRVALELESLQGPAK